MCEPELFCEGATVNAPNYGFAKEDISGKNKANGLVKLAAVLQVVWFTLQCITRAIHQLPLATLETMTLEYVFNALVTYAFWWEKPKDIITASFIDLPQMTPAQWPKFESLAMENTYDVSHPSQKQHGSIAWYVVPRNCRDDEVGMMEDQEQDLEESASFIEANINKVEPNFSLTEEDTSIITEWDANLRTSLKWEGMMTFIKIGSPLLYLSAASFAISSEVITMGGHKRRNVLVTGANGYIGLAVCRAFVRAGWNTYGLIRNPKAREELMLSEIIPVVGSFTNLGFLDILFKQVDTFDVIVSCTEQVPGYAAHFEEVIACVKILAVQSNREGVRPLVLWSSGCKDYGTTALHSVPGLRAHTEDSPLNAPEILKERTVNSAKVFDYTNLFDATVLRPTCVFGYSSSYYGAIFDYAEAQRGVHSQVLRVPGNANSIMHATHVDDCGDAYVSLAEHKDRGAIVGQFFNISSHRYETLDEIATSMAKEYGFEKGVSFVPPDEAEPSFPHGLHFVFSFSQWVGSDKLRSLTGWKDRRALFSEGIHSYRLAYEAFKGRRHDNVAEIQRRIETVLKHSDNGN
ncbi:hypothetical protein FLONG3_8361 [Fusarium longipes]|uniref:NAD-dependent epimerase/dehydratase domain-containing protein n=1 Tax=Fusarium longipes TaxID=694270 RepID=A0A395S649_9HYPO|nr:hypothetical protein FLONG3_8361 [Fusarium longipes]